MIFNFTVHPFKILFDESIKSSGSKVNSEPFSGMFGSFSPACTKLQMIQHQTQRTAVQRTWPEICGWAPLSQTQCKRIQILQRNPNTHRSVWHELLPADLYPSYCARRSIQSLSTGDSRIYHCIPEGCWSSYLYGWCSWRRLQWKIHRSTLPPSNAVIHWAAPCTGSGKIHRTAPGDLGRTGLFAYGSPGDSRLRGLVLYGRCWDQM